jgi:hypothetical protein
MGGFDSIADEFDTHSESVAYLRRAIPVPPSPSLDRLFVSPARHVAGVRRSSAPQYRTAPSETPCPRVLLWLGSQLLSPFLDSGATHSVVPSNVVEKLALTVEPSHFRWIEGIGPNSRSAVLGSVRIDVTLANRPGVIDFLVLPDASLEDTLLGVDVCHEWELAFSRPTADGTPTIWLAGTRCYLGTTSHGEVYIPESLSLAPLDQDTEEQDLIMVDRRDDATSSLPREEHFVAPAPKPLPRVVKNLRSANNNLVAFSKPLPRVVKNLRSANNNLVAFSKPLPRVVKHPRRQQ